MYQLYEILFDNQARAWVIWPVMLGPGPGPIARSGKIVSHGLEHASVTIRLTLSLTCGPGCD